jgi:hypothetical protein
MRPIPLSRLGGWLFCLWLWGCSLSLENPDLDARKKIAKVIPTTMADLVGRWKGDSTFTVDDTHASVVKDGAVWLEIFADTSYSQLDTSRLVFPTRSDGVYYLSGDTLITCPNSSAPDTFIVQLTFLGNYLQLTHPADQRFSFFHKIKPQDSATQIGMLKDSLWRMQGRRLDPGIFQVETLERNYSYYRFSGDSMFSDDRRNGVVRVDSGPLIKKGFNWTWKATGGAKEFLADLVKPDSLRMWTLTEGRPDSGYSVYIRTFGHHLRDLDMRPMIGHMRCDSILFGTGMEENHYGRFYDWTLTEDHKVAVETNIKNAPLFNAWTLDSGYLALDAPGYKRMRMRLNTPGGKVELRPDSAVYFGKGAVVSMTKVDPAKFRTKPLERFETASYLELIISGDTADYFFNANAIGDRFEIKRFTGDSTYWASITLNKSQETFQSSQTGFYFAFEGRNRALGRYLCRSRPAKDLVIRQTVASDPIMAQGLVQGACQIIHADSAFADSTLNLDGSFRLKRRSYGGFFSRAWNVP